jgi:hypothetical protein
MRKAAFWAVLFTFLFLIIEIMIAFLDAIFCGSFCDILLAGAGHPTGLGSMVESSRSITPTQLE